MESREKSSRLWFPKAQPLGQQREAGHTQDAGREGEGKRKTEPELFLLPQRKCLGLWSVLNQGAEPGPGQASDLTGVGLVGAHCLPTLHLPVTKFELLLPTMS